MEVKTDQKSVQVYTCNAIEHPDYPIPQKVSHQGPKRFYENHSCVVIEQRESLFLFMFQKGAVTKKKKKRYSCSGVFFVWFRRVIDRWSSSSSLGRRTNL